MPISPSPQSHTIWQPLCLELWISNFLCWWGNWEFALLWVHKIFSWGCDWRVVVFCRVVVRYVCSWWPAYEVSVIWRMHSRADVWLTALHTTDFIAEISVVFAVTGPSASMVYILNGHGSICCILPCKDLYVASLTKHDLGSRSSISQYTSVHVSPFCIHCVK